jgi:hypothetical protein
MYKLVVADLVHRSCAPSGRHPHRACPSHPGSALPALKAASKDTLACQ